MTTQTRPELHTCYLCQRPIYGEFVIRDEQYTHEECLTPEQQELVAGNIALVHWVVGRMRDFWLGNIPEDDAVGAGMLGLCRAARRWKPERGIKFGTYAYWAIARDITTESVRRRSVIYLPHALKDMPPDLRAMARRALNICSLDTPPDSVKDTRMAWTPNVLAIEDERTTETRESICSMHEALGCLDDRTRQSLTLYYFSGLTLREIGKRLGNVSKERVRQINERGIAKLRQLLGVEAAEVA